MSMSPSTRAFVLLSGGIDSTTALHMAREQHDAVEAISFNYGQRHFKEMEYAHRTTERLSIEHTILSIQGLSGNKVMLTDASVKIPDVSYDQIEGVSPTYVPFRNGTMLSHIAAHAQKWVMSNLPSFRAEWGTDMTDGEFLIAMKDTAYIYFGAHAEDAHNWAYPDCTPEFIGAMANAIYTGTYYTVRLNTPLMWMKKWQIIQEGALLGVEFDDTWSCYAGGELHCGTCPTCRARKEAFQNACETDPTEYADI